MNSKSFARRISLLFFVFSQIEAFNFHALGPRSKISRMHVDDAKGDLREAAVNVHEKSGLFHDGKDDTYSNVIETPDEACSRAKDTQWSRNQFLTFGLAAATAATWSSSPDTASAKLYSENAANLERINNGDFSGGAVFNNNPDTERGKKRRAMTGCKVTMSREEASKNILKRNKVMSEKECNTMVMDGETEFMLQALRNLDCPTCANGIGRAN